MNYDLAVTVVADVRGALGHALTASVTIKPVSITEAETYDEILMDATLGLYGILERIYTLHPSLGLSGDELSEETESSATETGNPAIGPLDDATIRRVQTALQNAGFHLDRADLALERADPKALSVEMRDFIRTHFSNARAAISTAAGRLAFDR